ncbi:MAG: exosome complex protein Rrp42 [Candidatus Aenigmarchaeota archaeon]|nr:exosome complex protein Rrp42 [Candidatus Aenigmarchaeota archaeon]MDW8149214.1 exosome complex protein Rrp42 [Candidatus Aenigmarchaeota archaeon]
MSSEYLLKLLRNGKREDGRGLNEFRKISFKTGIIKKAEGSAVVNFGNTSVIAGVKLDVGEPFSDSPNEGILIVNAEFSPIAAPFFEPGPPDENAIELARIVDRGIRGSNLIDFEKLCIKEGEKVWIVYIDIHTINNDGNLIDVSFLASILALKTTLMPKYEGKIIREEKVDKLPLRNYFPINISTYKAENILFIDPSLKESNLAEACLSICIRDDDKINSVQKIGSGSFSFEEIEKIFNLTKTKAREIRNLLSSSYIS